MRIQCYTRTSKIVFQIPLLAGFMVAMGCAVQVQALPKSIMRAPREGIYPPDLPLCCPSVEATCNIVVTGTLTGDITVNAALQQIGSPTYLNLTVTNTMTVAEDTCAPYVQADHSTVQNELFANYYSHGHDYQIMSADKEIFSSFGGEVIVTPTDGAVGDTFGSSVAMSAEGSIVVVGAPSKGGSSGVAYILQRNFSGTTTWPSVQEIPDPAALALDFFGNAVAVSGDGTVVAIGSLGPLFNLLYIYAYDITTNQWLLTPSAFAFETNLANNSIAVSGSGKWIVDIGGTLVTPLNGRVYQRQDDCSALSTWMLHQTLVTEISSVARASAAISADGKTIALGLPFAIAGGTGAVYIYQQDSTTLWVLQQIIKPLGSLSFGYAVSLSGDGQYLLVGDPLTGANGTAFVYVQRGPQWILESTFAPSSGSNFGTVVSLSADGTVATISSTSTTGVVDIWFRSPDNNWTRWFSFAGHTATAALGTGLAVSLDGSFIAAGAPDGGLTSGTVSIFRPAGALIPGNTSVTGNLCVATGTLTVNNDLFVAGDLTLSGVISTTGGIVPCTPSDEHLKEDVRALPAQEAFAILDELRPVEFSWICPHEHREGTRRVVGFIAQEVKKIRPKWVLQKDPSGDEAALFEPGEKQLHLLIQPEIFAFLVAALQELDRRAEDRFATLHDAVRGS